MKTSYITNLLLLIAILGLLWFLQRPPQQNITNDTLSTLTAEDVTDIRIQRPDRPELHMQKQHGNWYIASPFQAKANNTRIKLILKQLNTPIQTRFTVNNNNDLTQYGLLSPAVKLILNELEFDFGNVESLSQQRYVFHQQQIMLINDEATPLLNASADSFIDNRLITQPIQKLALPAVNGKPLSLTQTAGQWQANQSAFNTDELTQLIDSWQHAYAVQVHHDDSPVSTTPDAATVHVWLENTKEPVTLVVTETAHSLVLFNPANQLHYDFPTALKRQLFPTSKTE